MRGLHTHGMLPPLAAALLLTGCGGNSPLSSNQPPVYASAPMSASVDLPTGSSLDPSTLTASNSLTQASVGSNKSFSLPSFQGAPQFTSVTNRSGNPVLLGWVSSARPTVSARTTAEVLLYFQLDCYVNTFDAQQTARDLLATASEVQPVADAISAAILSGSTNPLQSAGVTSALTTACQSLLGSGANVAAQAPSSTKRDILVPGETRSGITLQQSNQTGITITNAYRRRAYAYVNRLSYIPASGGAAVASAAAVQELDVPMPTGVGSVVSSLVDFIRGKRVYVPKTSDPVSLPLYPADATATKYQVTIVGVGDSAGDYNYCTQAQWQKTDEIWRRSVLQDYMLPLLLNLAIPQAKDKIDAIMNAQGFAGVLKDFTGIILAKAPAVWEKADKGKVWEAAKDGIQALTTNGTFRTALIGRAASWLYPWVADPKVTTQAGFSKSITDAVSKVTLVIDVLLTAFDSAAQIDGVINSDMADIWNVTVTPAKVAVDPTSQGIFTGDTLTLHCYLGAKPTTWPTDPTQSGLTYHWTNTATAGLFSQVSTQDVQTASSAITYQANHTQSGTDTITVEVLSGDGANQVSLGKASCTITVTYAIKATAYARCYQYDTYVTLPAGYGSPETIRRNFVYFAMPKPTGFTGATWWAWKLHTNGSNAPAYWDSLFGGNANISNMLGWVQATTDGLSTANGYNQPFSDSLVMLTAGSFTVSAPALGSNEIGVVWCEWNFDDWSNFTDAAASWRSANWSNIQSATSGWTMDVRWAPGYTNINPGAF